jgi:hypothetical protein
MCARQPGSADLARLLRQSRQVAVDWSGPAAKADAKVPSCLA